ncbi:hypothetical protein DIPPA_07153 [Diplonema papillatum]|nr:hypothetical protein DIPPA_07153 [Diplonema papillatum]
MPLAPSMRCNLVVLALLALVTTTAAWSTGDFVPIYKRSLYEETMTDWLEMGPDLSPRFGRNKVIRLHGLENVDIGGGDYKIAFELGHGLGRRTTWITVQSGCTSNSQQCHVLTHLTFWFTYEMHNYGKIVDFQAIPTYSERRDGHNDRIIVDYRWKEESDKDLHTALVVLYFVSVVVSFLLLSIMFVSTEAVRKGEMLVKDVVSQ